MVRLQFAGITAILPFFAPDFFIIFAGNSINILINTKINKPVVFAVESVSGPQSDWESLSVLLSVTHLLSQRPHW